MNFGRPFDEDKYKKSLNIVAEELDLNAINSDVRIRFFFIFLVSVQCCIRFYPGSRLTEYIEMYTTNV